MTRSKSATAKLPVSNGRLTYQSSQKIKRVTILMPANIDLNIEMIALYEGRLKTAVITEALQWYLQEVKGIPEPTTAPTMSWERAAKPKRNDDLPATA
jgi:hypothetical protein